jgi:hypothetical protein
VFWEIKLKVETAIVGDTFNKARGVFEFAREGEAWGLDLNTLHTWDSLIFNAATSLQLPHAYEAIRLPSTILLPTLHLLTRNKRGKEGKGSGKNLYHEMIPRGTVLTLQFMTREKGGDRHIRTPNHGELCQIFAFIGAYEGCSPFGSSAGYGRFKVKNLDALGRAPFNFSQLPPGGDEGTHLLGEADGDSQLQAGGEAGSGRGV